jgi:hypothetical protein
MPLFLIASLVCMGTLEDTGSSQTPTYLPADVVADLSMTRVKAHVDLLAADDMGGRVPGSVGHIVARDYLAGEMASVGLEPFDDQGFIWSYPTDGPNDALQINPDGTVGPAVTDTGHNLIGLIPGIDPELADQYIVVMAHYDHLGATDEGEIYNGAFDDATGTAVLLEIARTLIGNGVQPRRTLMFILTDEEEFGLNGAEQWLAEQMVPHESIVFGVSLDPIGRGVLPDYWPVALMGLERTPKLLTAWRQFAMYAEMDVVFVHRDIIPVFSSDQDEFYRVQDPIPALWFTSPGMSFYHTVDDTPETIDYRSVQQQSRFLMQALAFFGDDDRDYPYRTVPEIGPEHAAEVRVMIRGVLASAYLSDEHRDEAQGILDELNAVVESNSIEALSMGADPFFVYAIYFLVFYLPTQYPGEIPPPFPVD